MHGVEAAAVTRHDVERFVHRAGLAADTRRNELSILRTFWRWLIITERVDEDPTPPRRPDAVNLPALLTDEQPLVDPALLAAAGFLAGYGNASTRSGYTISLRKWWTFCEEHGLAVLEAKRAHLDLYVRSLEERGYAPGTVYCRLSNVASFYLWCHAEEVIDRNPAAHVRRPKVSLESTTLGLNRGEIDRFLVAAELAGTTEHALACLLALNGLRVSEACNADTGNLGSERGHHTLLIVRKGGKRVTIPLAPRAYRAVMAAVGERTAGPVLLWSGRRLTRFQGYGIVKRIVENAGVGKRISPHSLRHSFITAALDAGVPFRDVQEAASHSDPKNTMRYDRNRVSLDRHAAYAVDSFVEGVDDMTGEPVTAPVAAGPVPPAAPIPAGNDRLERDVAALTETVTELRGLLSQLGHRSPVPAAAPVEEGACGQCGARDTRPGWLEFHRTKPHCPECGKWIPARDGRGTLAGHRRDAHGVSFEDGCSWRTPHEHTKGGHCICPLCRQSSATIGGDPIMATHHASPHTPCPDCNRSFVNLAAHRRRAHPWATSAG